MQTKTYTVKARFVGGRDTAVVQATNERAAIAAFLAEMNATAATNLRGTITQANYPGCIEAEVQESVDG